MSHKISPSLALALDLAATILAATPATLPYSLACRLVRRRQVERRHEDGRLARNSSRGGGADRELRPEQMVPSPQGPEYEFPRSAFQVRVDGRGHFLHWDILPAQGAARWLRL